MGQSFEQALLELEKRVVRLEHGELELDEALKVFEEGVALVRECHEKLDDAEVRIATLSREGSGTRDPGTRDASGTGEGIREIPLGAGSLEEER